MKASFANIKDLITQRLDSDPRLSYSQPTNGTLIAVRRLSNSGLTHSKLTMQLDVVKDHCQVQLHYKNRVFFIPTASKKSTMTLCTAEAVSYATKQFLTADLANVEMSELSSEIMMTDQIEIRRRTQTPFKA